MKTVDPRALPPLDATQQADLARLAARDDAAIDTSDAPELSDAQLADMRRGALYRPIKRQVTVRIDADVLDWFRARGKGYQSRINAALRAAMLKDG